MFTIAMFCRSLEEVDWKVPFAIRWYSTAHAMIRTDFYDFVACQFALSWYIVNPDAV
jgi:hypothetical protein